MMKKIIKLFIPPILLRLLRALERINRKNTLSAEGLFYSTIRQHKKETDTLFILGNGPTLAEQLVNYSDILTEKTCCCVNSFVLTDYYEKLKPKLYVIMDPAVFTVSLSNKLRDVEEESIAIIETLVAKTSWKIDIVIPSQFRNNERVILLKSNPFINVLFVNTIVNSKCESDEEKFKLFNLNEISAPAQNVLNTAVYLAIFWKYNTIVLIGAELSMHKYMEVDAKTNMLYGEAHSYGYSSRIQYKDTMQGIPFKLHEMFSCITRMFELFWLLREYAEYNSVKVFNASAISYIDAFDRAAIEDFFDDSDNARLKTSNKKSIE
jgi:hypothetical protein